MPTARDLLEQADALMRRNRLQQVDDIPVLTDVAGATPGAQVLRGRGAPGRTPPPDHAAGVDIERLREGDSIRTITEGDSVPTLTDDVFAPTASDGIGVQVGVDDGLGAAPEDGDTIPTLTERVLGIATEEAMPALVATDAGGEPSDWLRHPTANPSVMGAMPDSVLAVPATDAPAQVANAIDVEHIDVVEPTFADPADEAFAVAVAPDAQTPILQAAPLEPAPEDILRAPPGVGMAPALAPEFSAPAPALSGPAPEFSAPAPALSGPAPEFSAPAPALFGHAPALPEPALAPRDDAHWQGVAEDIRMQVLQRIDIFTDTGLREQLAVRLQPIVDRASADLVATINQHVGDLLRAYVAEAIEREIDNWRRSH